MIKLKISDIVLVKNGVSFDSKVLDGQVVKILKIKKSNLPHKNMKQYYMVSDGVYGVWAEEISKVLIDRQGRAVDINGRVIGNNLILK